MRGLNAFESQDSTQTLAEGLAEYYRENPQLATLRAMSPAGREFFRCHDTVHVVFGCNTSLPHEAVVKLSSVFGTTGGFAILKGYTLHEATEIYWKLSLREMVQTFFRAVVLVPRTLFRCLRQRKRWPWNDFAAYAERPLGSLRAEFGIRVPGASSHGA